MTLIEEIVEWTETHKDMNKGDVFENLRKAHTESLEYIARLIEKIVELEQEVESVQACYTDSQLNRGL